MLLTFLVSALQYIDLISMIQFIYKHVADKRKQHNRFTNFINK